MTDLTTFLSARLDELETTARAATPGPWAEWPSDRFPDRAPGVCSHAYTPDNIVIENGEATAKDARHIATHDPAYVLADVEAKRAVLAIESLNSQHRDVIVRALAKPWSAHPDFDPAWLA